MPFTIVAIVITVLMPMTTPRIVSADRILLTRSVSTAIPMFSRMCSTRRMERDTKLGSYEARKLRGGERHRSFGSQCDDGIEAGGAASGIDAEQHADASA